MQFEIDKQDLVNLTYDTRKPFDRARMGLIVSLSVLMTGAFAAAYQTYVSAGAFLNAAPSLSGEGFARAYAVAPEAGQMTLLSLTLFALCVYFITAVIRARRKREASRKNEILSHTLSIGRFDYTLALDQLIIKGPLAIKKISWARIASITKKRHSIIFWRRDGTYDFIPKNILPRDSYYDEVMAKHAATMAAPCPFEEANHAGPLSITFETSRADMDEFFKDYFRRRDGRAHIFRRVGQWRPWTPILFFACALIAASSAFAAFAVQDLVFAGMSFGFAGAAAAIFVLNSNYFRGAAFPFRKDKSWPFAQTDLATVTLSKNGVHRKQHGMSELLHWGAFERYFETRLYGYLVISGKSVIALPKRAFLSKPHFEKFTGFARKAIADAKHARSEAKAGRMMRAVGKQERAKPAAKAKAALAQAMPDAVKKSAAVKMPPPVKTAPQPASKARAKLQAATSELQGAASQEQTTAKARPAAPTQKQKSAPAVSQQQPPPKPQQKTPAAPAQKKPAEKPSAEASSLGASLATPPSAQPVTQKKAAAQ